MVIFPEIAALVTAFGLAAAEWQQARRVQRLAALAFGPGRRAARWTMMAPALRVAAATALMWALATLAFLPPKTHEAKKTDPTQLKHVVLVLDVSPSMKLKDAGPNQLQTRAERAATLLQSFFERVPMEQVRLSVIATYTSAKPVVIDTRDVGVVKNILTDLPLSHAFAAGSTDLFSGLAEAARVAQAWPRDSTTVVVVSDGDTVPPSGMPEMPPSVSHTVLIGLGDTRTGQFINGHQSRQDAATLKQVAIRLRGVYHDGNQKHLPSDLLRDITALEAEGTFKKLTRREYALAAMAIGAATLAALPWALHFVGTSRRPSRRPSRRTAVTPPADHRPTHPPPAR
jgi:Ca-activated chloride channel family protein